jgi:hypothetical protein
MKCSTTHTVTYKLLYYKENKVFLPSIDYSIYIFYTFELQYLADVVSATAVTKTNIKYFINGSGHEGHDFVFDLI